MMRKEVLKAEYRTAKGFRQGKVSERSGVTNNGEGRCIRI